jgi:pyruvate dehydrogenase E2 component (dihydrolipoamide acetyltransferase)
MLLDVCNRLAARAAAPAPAAAAPAVAAPSRAVAAPAAAPAAAPVAAARAVAAPAVDDVGNLSDPEAAAGVAELEAELCRLLVLKEEVVKTVAAGNATC